MRKRANTDAQAAIHLLDRGPYQAPMSTCLLYVGELESVAIAEDHLGIFHVIRIIPAMNLVGSDEVCDCWSQAEELFNAARDEIDNA